MHEEEIQRIKQQFCIIGNSKSLNRAIEVAIQVAPTAMTVLITGESGSGKESFSKIIHSLSPYKHGKFMALNCGAIPEGTIDSELFGHEKGAFTGANEARKGYFEEAHGGTIFLDEIGEMPLGTQTRLLRVLEYGEFMKVGSSKLHKIHVRVVAATNVNLVQAVDQGKFRKDLYYRLNTVPIFIPSLRERGTDILLLFRKFATDFANHYYVKPIQLTKEAQEVLMNYPFPGNIRQLKNLVAQISVLEMERTITQEKLIHYLPKELCTLPIPYQDRYLQDTMPEKEILYQILFDMKKDMHELKTLVFQWLHTTHQGHKLIKEHALLFNSICTPLPATSEQSPQLDAMSIAEQPTAYEKVPTAYEKVPTAYEKVPTAEVPEEENFFIVAKEKELINKALHKYQHKRKEAAKSLGISERTLYRKIKQYSIE